MDIRHVLLVTFPAQGHINPSLQFAKRLINMGIQVTFATTLSARRRMAKAAGTEELLKGLTFAPFSDGYDDGFKFNSDDTKKYMTQIRSRGSETLKNIILTSSENGRPITRLVYTLLLPWAAEVAREFHVPSALLWIQPASVLNIYYYYFNGFSDEFPGVPLLMSKHDLPSFLLPSSSDQYGFALPTFKEQIETLNIDSEITKTKILVNTFDALEPDALKGVEKYELIGVGPLINIPNSKDNSFSGGDLFEKPVDDYKQWLDSKDESSVIYVSFGSLLRLPKPQMEEIAKGLLDCNRPFLWVIRANENEEDDKKYLSCLEELEKLGKIVTWCSQIEVLTHPSLGCFVTHCGWNSTLESILCGVPVVAFPRWTDQGTNAKLIEDLWGIGVRVGVNEENNNGLVESGEIWRCIEEVMDGGDQKSRELREKAKEWSVLARKAMEEDGSSTNNLKAFFN
ncbi:hypothetical protein ACJIZ3_009764 [Penstemon smallii]|uniref:Glycosyltransferase n=1 Tax=Penstemon smallii TaxID=265156 RepID=A0ABD3TEQ2_9LAMI